MIVIQHNTPVLITSDCNQCNQLQDRQAPQFFTEFADDTHDEQHRCMGLNSHGVSKVSVRDAADVKQVEQ